MKVPTLWRVILLSGAAALTGCSSWQPWVKPDQRGNLADPIMAFERDPIAGCYLQHVYEAHEAARGAEGSAGGGCDRN